MNVEITKDIAAADLDLLKQLYEESFPAEERRDWQLIVSPVSDGCPRLFEIIADGHLAGMLTLWQFEHFAYVEHLAVDPALRGKGIGSEAMRLLMEKIGMKPVVIEIEPPVADKPMTVARHDFYRKLGFDTISTDYIQPPYAPSLPEVPMHLMATATLPSGSTAATLHHEVYGA